MVHEMKIYDQAVVEKFRITAQDPVDGAVVVPIVFSAPHRALARVERVYGQSIDLNRSELPIMSVIRNDVEPDPERYFHNPRVSWVNALDGADARVSKSPNPVRVPYQINIWTSQRALMNDIIKQCSLRTRNNLGYITVDLDEYGTKYFSFDYESVTDSSELTPGDTERNIRYTISLTLRCIIFRPITIVKVMTEAEIEFYEGIEDEDIIPENLLETLNIT